MSQLARVITKLQRVRDALRRPTEFYALYLPKWQERARRIATAILRNGRPSNIDPDAWQRTVALEAGRISGTLFFSEEEIGAVIALGIRPPGTVESDPKQASIAGLSIDEIESWVAAGRVKATTEDLGKTLDERDTNKSDLQIAWRVYWSMKLQKGNWDHLLKHIQDFLGATAVTEAQALHHDILRAWFTQLAPEIAEDFRAWLHFKVRQCMA